MSESKPQVVLEIQKRVNLIGVRLIRGQFSFQQAPAVLPPEWELDLNARVGGRKASAGEGFIQVIAGLDVTARPSSGGAAQKAPNAALVSCDFGLDYLITDAAFYADLKDSDVLQFGARNGMYNAWPYMRAHVQGIAAAMMLPIVLPTFRPEVTFPDLNKAVENAVRTAG